MLTNSSASRIGSRLPANRNARQRCGTNSLATNAALSASALDDAQLLVIANLSSYQVEPRLPARTAAGWHGADMLLSNLSPARGVEARLAPWEAKVYTR